MELHHVRRAGISTFLLALLGLLAWSLCLPLYVDAVLLLVLAFLCWRASPVESGILLAALLIALTIAEQFLSGSASPVTQHYREHEKYARIGQKYEPQVDDTITAPHGDLAALSPALPQSAYEPRTIRFKTDSRGYRNDHEYLHGQPVLVGDSFLISNGADQADTIQAQLKRELEVDVYTLGYPSWPLDYENRALDFLLQVDPHARFSFFFYEGNDFRSTPPPVKAPRSGFFKLVDDYDEYRINHFLRYAPSLDYPRVLYKLMQRVRATYSPEPTTQVDVRIIAEQSVGFYRLQTEAALDPNPRLNLDYAPAVWERTDCSFFIPTKARVYAAQQSVEFRSRLEAPSPALGLLRNSMTNVGVPVVDFTERLTKRAQTLLQEGKFLFWRDDSHWNAGGVSEVIADVKNCLQDRRADGPGRSAALGAMDAETITLFGSSYRIVPGGRGSVDVVQPFPFGQRILGWAVSKDGSANDIKIVAVSAGKIVGLSKTRLRREDVERALNSTDVLNAGFNIGFLTPAPAAEVEIFALLPSGEAFRIPR